MHAHRTLSVIVPCFNEATTIGLVVEELINLRTNLPGLEIIVVNDGSTDETQSVLRNYPDIKTVTLTTNRGKGFAMREGAARAAGTHLVFIDGDGENAPEEILVLCEVAQKNMADAVHGSRLLGHTGRGDSLFFWGGRAITALVNLLFATALTDVSTGFRVIRKDVWRMLPLTSDRFEIETELTARCALSGRTIFEVPISYRSRSKQQGKKLRLMDGIRAGAVALRIWAASRPTLFLRALRNVSRKEWFLFSITVAASALVYGLMAIFNPTHVEFGDGYFDMLAKNLHNFGVYSSSRSFPLLLHSAYTPLYPIIITPLVTVPFLIYVVNWILHGWLIVGIFRLAKVAGAGERLAFFAGLCAALEPYHLVITNTITPEILFALILLWLVSISIKYVQYPFWTRAATLGAVIALATLTRPSSLLLIGSVPVLNILQWGIHQWRRTLIHTAAACIAFALILSPWLLRNYYHFGTFTLTSLGANQMLNANIPHYLESLKGSSATEAGVYEETQKLRTIAESAAGHPFEFPLNSEDARVVEKSIVQPFLRERGFPFALFLLSQVPFEIAVDNWRTALENTTHIPQRGKTALSAFLQAVHGDFSGLASGFSLDAYFVAFVSGKIFWLALYVLSLIGVFALWRSRILPRPIILLFVGLILYFPFISVPYIDARYRFPGTPYVFVLAAAGLRMVVDGYRKFKRHG